MKQQAFLIELQEKCIFSDRLGQEGEHRSLDKIPGSALLGRVAAQLYQQLSRSQAWNLFHSGRLRFYDGLPWNGHSRGLPMPYAWHHPKLKSAYQADRLLAENIHNLIHVDEIKNNGQVEQPKQMRAGYVHPDGDYSKPRRVTHIKTAIDYRRGYAKKSQLFHYQALERGQSFIAYIEADDIDESLWQRVVDCLPGEAVLGASRSAEYGRARIRPIDYSIHYPAAEPEQQSSEPEQSKPLTVIWLLSDLALVDKYGHPSLNPEHIGLDNFNAQKSFMRTRRYAVWNQARRGYDQERWVISAGSVLVFDQKISKDDQLRLGLYRQFGLGEIWLNPPLLMQKQPEFIASNASTRTVQAVRPNHGLILWLEAQKGEDWKEKVDQEAQEWIKEYDSVLQKAKALLGLEIEQFSPSKSQWGEVLNAARSYSGRKLYNKLFTGNHAIIRARGSTDEGWSVKVPNEQQEWMALADWIKNKLPFQSGDHPQHYAYKLRRIAHTIRQRRA